jgi:hypothetical protein
MQRETNHATLRLTQRAPAMCSQHRLTMLYHRVCLDRSYCLPHVRRLRPQRGPSATPAGELWQMCRGPGPAPMTETRRHERHVGERAGCSDLGPHRSHR